MPEPLLPLSDPAVVAVPLDDRRESLIDVGTVSALRVDNRMSPQHDGFVLLRTTVVDRLVVAQSLLPRGLRLLIVEGYRTPALQQAHLNAYREDLRLGHADWPDDRIEAEASWYCAPPDAAPHVTGAAVDLTLCTTDGVELSMGCAIHAGPTASAGACATHAPALSPHARRHRATLGAVLALVGMVNLPSAWWHWSYGDRYWCSRTGASHAPYGPIEG
jgi:D-alanyl-D-alanine dipeptidase